MKMPKMNLEGIAMWLTLFGGVNWGLVGFLNFDLVKTVFGFAPVIIPFIYIAIGLSAIVTLMSYYKKN